MLFKLSSKRHALAIDIGSATIKLLEVSIDGSQYRVESYFVAYLPRNAITDKGISNVEAVASTIKIALQQTACRLKHVATALPSSSVMQKTITMPSGLSETQIEERILLDSEQYIPYPVDEINFDFQIQRKIYELDMIDVLLVASRRENINIRNQIFSRANLKIELIDVDVFAIERAMSFILKRNKIPKTSTVAIIDVGTTILTLTILIENKIIYKREQNFGGNQLTEEIQSRYGLSYEKANIAKKQFDYASNTHLHEIINPFIESLCSQVKRIFNLFYSSNQNKKIDHIFLVGGMASFSNIEIRLTNELLQSVKKIPLLNSIDISNEIDRHLFDQESPSLLTSLGLVLRQLNYDFD